MEEKEMVVDQTYRGNIWSSVQSRVYWRLYLTEMGDDPKNHIEAVDMIRSADVEDVIEIFITSQGGLVSVADMYLSAIKDSKAKVITRAIGECCSAATTVFLAGDERICDDGGYFMFHNVQMGSYGDSANIFASGKFYQKHYRDKFYSLMGEVLSETELQELFDRAGEIYVTAEDMRRRLTEAEGEEEAPEEWQVISGPPVDMVNLHWQTKPAPAAEVFGHGDEFDIVLDDGYRKTFRLGTLCTKDFDEYNRLEILEIGRHFGETYLGFTRDYALGLLISRIKTGRGED